MLLGPTLRGLMRSCIWTRGIIDRKLSGDRPLSCALVSVVSSREQFEVANKLGTLHGHRLQLSRNLRDSPGFADLVMVPEGLSTVLLFVPEVGWS